ncbi:hypothetical protein D3C80_1443620 [compost metagenome]
MANCCASPSTILTVWAAFTSPLPAPPFSVLIWVIPKEATLLPLVKGRLAWLFFSSTMPSLAACRERRAWPSRSGALPAT